MVITAANAGAQAARNQYLNQYNHQADLDTAQIYNTFATPTMSYSPSPYPRDHHLYSQSASKEGKFEIGSPVSPAHLNMSSVNKSPRRRTLNNSPLPPFGKP